MNWYVLELVGRGHYRIRVRKWHPGLWREVYRTLRASGNGRFVSVWYTAYFMIKV